MERKSRLAIVFLNFCNGPGGVFGDEGFGVGGGAGEGGEGAGIAGVAGGDAGVAERAAAWAGQR